MGRPVCLRMGCLTGCDCVARTSSLACLVLVRIMGIYASASRGYGFLDIATLLYSLAILLGILRPAVGGQEEMGCIVTARYQFMIMTLNIYQHLPR